MSGDDRCGNFRDVPDILYKVSPICLENKINPVYFNPKSLFCNGLFCRLLQAPQICCLSFLFLDKVEQVGGVVTEKCIT